MCEHSRRHEEVVASATPNGGCWIQKEQIRFKYFICSELVNAVYIFVRQIAIGNKKAFTFSATPFLTSLPVNAKLSQWICLAFSLRDVGNG